MELFLHRRWCNRYFIIIITIKRQFMWHNTAEAKESSWHFCQRKGCCTRVQQINESYLLFDRLVLSCGLIVSRDGALPALHCLKDFLKVDPAMPNFRIRL